MLPVNRNSTLVQVAASTLKGEILTGRLQAGARIHLTTTAARLEMSPIPVREALQTLASQGLVELLPRKGYRVQAANLADLEDTYRLRLILDPLAVELAVPNLGAAGLVHLENSLRLLTDAQERDDWEANRQWHTAFHFGIYSQARSPWLTRLLQMLWDSSERYQRQSAVHRGTLPERVLEHSLVLEACRGGDPKAASDVMREHLNRTYETVRKQEIAAARTVP